MRVTPITAEEANEQSVGDPWPAGIYDFMVKEADEAISAAGNEQIKLTLHIFNRNSQQRTVFDYLSSSKKAQWKVRHFAESVGMVRQYDTGDMPTNQMLDRPGRCKLGIEEASGTYAAKNKVLDYVTQVSGMAGVVNTAPPVRSKVKTPADDINDEIPF